ncbi:MAG: hypothetical protein QM656_05125 [Paracoccaceae bacterium]
MSEPMTSAEIEDVLSSIRRLVSDEMRPGLARDEAAPAAQGKLLLTPALRVVPDTGTGAAEEAAQGGELAERVAALSAAYGQRDEWEDQEDAADPGTEVAEAGFWTDEAEAWAEPETVEFVAFPGGEIPTKSGEASILDAEILDAGAPLAPQVAEPVAEEETLIPEQADDDLVPGWAQQEPDEGEQSPLILATAQAWAGSSRDRVVTEFRTKRDPGRDPGARPAEEPARGALPTEDELRALVRELIREEIQGYLGERITRNVRKLVRAEIALALALHDLD